MNNIPYIDILILAMIAVFIINRLRSVLGKKTGNEADIVEKFTQKKANFKESEPDIVLKEKNSRIEKITKPEKFHSNKKINDTLNNISKTNPEFTVNSFIDGAKKAFEYILNKYSKNNFNNLDKLLSKNLFENFKNQISERKDKGESLEITVISVKNPKIIDALLEKKSFAIIKLCFDSEQIQVTKNDKGEVIEGNKNKILSIKENWTFSKNLKNKDPNWVLEKIEENG